MKNHDYPHHKNHHHTINNIEFNVQDINAMKAFYGAVFGWKFKSFGETYLEFNDGHMLGGFFKVEEKPNRTGGPLIIIYSEDLSKSEARIIENSGTITVPTFSFPGGKRFHFKDVEGNELAVWSE